MTDEIRVKLTIASNTLSAKEVSALLGIEADSSQILGEMNRLGTKPYPQHAWVLKEKYEVNSTETMDQLEMCLSKFLARVGSASSIIRNLSIQHLVEVGIYVFAREVPAIFLSKGQVEAIAALGASVDVDVVLYNDTSHE